MVFARLHPDRDCKVFKVRDRPPSLRDVAASRPFYAAVLEPLGLRITARGDGLFSADELFVTGDGANRWTPSSVFELRERARSLS